MVNCVECLVSLCRFGVCSYLVGLLGNRVLFSWFIMKIRIFGCVIFVFLFKVRLVVRGLN